MVSPFDKNSTKDQLWKKVDLSKSISECLVGMGLDSLLARNTSVLTQPNGVELQGHAEMTLKIPSKSERNTGSSVLSRQAFFKEGNKHPVMVRFSNFGSCLDDRELTIRGADVKFSEHPVSVSSMLKNNNEKLD